jgi:hypothetical protein
MHDGTGRRQTRTTPGFLHNPYRGKRRSPNRPPEPAEMGLIVSCGSRRGKPQADRKGLCGPSRLPEGPPGARPEPETSADPPETPAPHRLPRSCSQAPPKSGEMDFAKAPPKPISMPKSCANPNLETPQHKIDDFCAKSLIFMIFLIFHWNQWKKQKKTKKNDFWRISVKKTKKTKKTASARKQVRGTSGEQRGTAGNQRGTAGNSGEHCGEPAGNSGEQRGTISGPSKMKNHKKWTFSGKNVFISKKHKKTHFFPKKHKKTHFFPKNTNLWPKTWIFMKIFDFHQNVYVFFEIVTFVKHRDDFSQKLAKNHGFSLSWADPHLSKSGCVFLAIPRHWQNHPVFTKFRGFAIVNKNPSIFSLWAPLGI